MASVAQGLLPDWLRGRKTATEVTADGKRPQASRSGSRQRRRTNGPNSNDMDHHSQEPPPAAAAAPATARAANHGESLFDEPSPAPARQSQTTASAAASGTGKRRRQHAGGGRSTNFDLSLQDIRLLTVSQVAMWYRMRQAEAALFTVITFLTASSIATALKNEGDTYHHATKGKSGHGMGPPHPWMIAVLAVTLHPLATPEHQAFIMEFLKLIGADCQPLNADSPEIAEHLKEARSKGRSVEEVVAKVTERRQSDQRKLIAQEIQVFRCKVCRDRTKTNLTFASRSGAPTVTNFLKAVIVTMETKAEGVVHFGMAPPSHTETQLQALLKRVEDSIHA
jgi:hypothetical protein